MEVISNNYPDHLSADCANCFGLCCVALPYAKSTDFAFDKDGGVPCKNLMEDYRCHIHKDLRAKGLRGCTVYECFGAGQKVSQSTFKGMDWRSNSELAQKMFNVFPIMQQLFEMLSYINEALNREETKTIYKELNKVYEDTERLTNLDPDNIISLDVPSHRAIVSEILSKVSNLVRANANNKQKKPKMKSEWIGSNLRGANLSGLNLRGALLIASDLREANLRMTDLLGADFRDADLRGADLTGSIFLTQAQINAAISFLSLSLSLSLCLSSHILRQLQNGG